MCVCSVVCVQYSMLHVTHKCSESDTASSRVISEIYQNAGQMCFPTKLRQHARRLLLVVRTGNDNNSKSFKAHAKQRCDEQKRSANLSACEFLFQTANCVTSEAFYTDP